MTWMIIDTEGQTQEVEADDLIDLMQKCPQAIYAKQTA